MFSKIQNKLENKFGNEILGELDHQERKKRKEKVHKKEKLFTKKEKKETKPIVDNNVNNSNVNNISKQMDFVKKSVGSSHSTINKSSGSTNNKNYPVLDFLGIKKDVDISGLVTPEDIDNTQFGLIAPTGIDPAEVEEFCEKIQRDIYRYQEIINGRQHDFLLLLNEVVKLEQSLVERQQQGELNNFLSHSENSENEELIKLRIENEELKSQLADLKLQSMMNVIKNDNTMTTKSEQVSKNDINNSKTNTIQYIADEEDYGFVFDTQQE